MFGNKLATIIYEEEPDLKINYVGTSSCTTELTTVGYVYSLGLIVLGISVLIILFKLWRMSYSSQWLGRLLIFTLLLVTLISSTFWFVTNVLEKVTYECF